MTILAFGHTKQLAAVGIPITGKIATFQQKHFAKNYRVDAKENKKLPTGENLLVKLETLLRSKIGNKVLFITFM